MIRQNGLLFVPLTAQKKHGVSAVYLLFGVCGTDALCLCVSVLHVDLFPCSPYAPLTPLVTCWSTCPCALMTMLPSSSAPCTLCALLLLCPCVLNPLVHLSPHAFVPLWPSVTNTQLQLDMCSRQARQASDTILTWPCSSCSASHLSTHPCGRGNSAISDA